MYAGKTAVITGAGSGIGRVLALKLAGRGAEVWAVDVDAEALAALADEAEKYGHSITTRAADVRDRTALTEIRDELLAARRKLDIWINNAGIAGIGGFLELGADEFDRVLDVNLKALVNGTRLALESMEEAGTGQIVNMASVAGHLPAPYMSAYCASKHAVIGFSRALQAELKLKSSPVNLLLVSPGFVDTRIIAKGDKLGFPEWLSFMLATPESVAEAVLRGMSGRRDEIYPTLNGKLMKRLYGIFPQTTVRSSKLMLAKSWKDVFGR